MLTATIGELRNGLADYVERVEQEKTRIVITRHGHPSVAIVNLDDLRIIERIDRQIDEIIARAVLDDIMNQQAIPWEEALQQLASRKKANE